MSIKSKTSAEKIQGIPVNEIREALVNEYRRRRIRYKLVDEAMKKKYGIDYAEFESKNMVRERKLAGMLNLILWNGSTQSKDSDM